jgi:hypothetical protein
MRLPHEVLELLAERRVDAMVHVPNDELVGTRIEPLEADVRPRYTRASRAPGIGNRSSGGTSRRLLTTVPAGAVAANGAVARAGPGARIGGPSPSRYLHHPPPRPIREPALGVGLLASHDAADEVVLVVGASLLAEDLRVLSPQLRHGHAPQLAHHLPDVQRHASPPFSRR